MSQEELAAVKTEMERKVDQLHSQLHYWQNVTVKVLNEHCSSINKGIFIFCWHSITPTQYPNISKGPGSSLETGDTVLTSTIFNITQNGKHISV